MDCLATPLLYPELCSWLPEELRMSWCPFLHVLLLLSVTRGSPWFRGHCNTQKSDSHQPIALGLRNELRSSAPLIPVKRTSGKASGSCWRTEKYGCTPKKFLLHEQRLFPAGPAVSSQFCPFPLVLHTNTAWKQLLLDLAWKKTKLCFCCFSMFTC